MLGTAGDQPGARLVRAGRGGQSSDDAQCTQKVSVQPSSTYKLSGYVQGAYVFVGDSGTGSSDTSNWTASAPGWQQLSTSFTTGASTTSVTIYVHGWYGEGTYYADDFTLSGAAGSGGGGGGGGTAVPGAPAGLTVTGTSTTSVSLSWTAPSGTVTSYNVYENGTKAATVAGTTDTVTGLDAGASYTFAVAATNSAGESASRPRSRPPRRPPGGGGGGGGSSGSGELHGGRRTRT